MQQRVGDCQRLLGSARSRNMPRTPVDLYLPGLPESPETRQNSLKIGTHIVVNPIKIFTNAFCHGCPTYGSVSWFTPPIGGKRKEDELTLGLERVIHVIKAPRIDIIVQVLVHEPYDCIAVTCASRWYRCLKPPDPRCGARPVDSCELVLVGIRFWSTP